MADPTPPSPADAALRLQQLLASVDAEGALAKQGAGTVTLDQSSVGRLSRMDALQQQAMAQAAVQRLVTQRRRVLAALDRVAQGRYGRCCECDGEVEPARLQFDPTALFCLECQAERQADRR